MEISAFLVRLIFLLLPGVVWRMVFVQLTGGREKRDWEDFLKILFYSVIGYLSYWIIVKLIWIPLWIFKSEHALSLTQVSLNGILQPFIDINKDLNFNHIFFATIISIPVAFVSAYFYSYKIVNKIGQKIKATKHYGDQDVWEFLMNSSCIKQIVVRDHKLNLIYYGVLGLFSDDRTKNDRELLLYNVDVFANQLEGNDQQKDQQKSILLYDTPMLYICRNRADISIEIPVLNEILIT